MPSTNSSRVIALALALLLTLAACGGDDDDSAADDTASGDDTAALDGSDAPQDDDTDDTEPDGGDDTEPDDGDDDTLDNAGVQRECDALAVELGETAQRGDALLESEYGSNDPAPETELGDGYREVIDIFSEFVLGFEAVLDLADDWTGAEDIRDAIENAKANQDLLEAAFESFEDDASSSTTFGELFSVLTDSGADPEFGRPVLDAFENAGIDCDVL